MNIASAKKNEIVSGVLTRNILIKSLVKLCSVHTHVVSCALRDHPVEHMRIAWIPVYSIIYLVAISRVPA